MLKWLSKNGSPLTHRDFKDKYIFYIKTSLIRNNFILINRLSSCMINLNELVQYTVLKGSSYTAKSSIQGPVPSALLATIVVCETFTLDVKVKVLFIFKEVRKETIRLISCMNILFQRKIEKTN